MTLLEELGFTCKVRELSEEQLKVYHSAAYQRRRKKTGYLQKLKDRHREYRLANPDAHRAWSANNPERIKEYGARWYAKNKERANRSSREYAKANRESLNRWRVNRLRERCQSDPGFRLKYRLRIRLSEVCKNAGTKSTKLNLDADALRSHMESLWQEGMSWENYGSGWHIDHKLPCAYFDFTDPEQARKCFSLENLQPMWARENIRKRDKILPEYMELAS